MPKPFQKPLPAPRGAPAQLQAARVARRLSAGATQTTSVRGLVRGRSARCDADAGAPGAAGHDPARHSLRRGASARPCWLPAARADGGGRDPSWSLRARFCSLFCSSTPAPAMGGGCSTTEDSVDTPISDCWVCRRERRTIAVCTSYLLSDRSFPSSPETEFCPLVRAQLRMHRNRLRAYQVHDRRARPQPRVALVLGRPTPQPGVTIDRGSGWGSGANHCPPRADLMGKLL